MKHLFTLSERSKDKWVSFATFATFASAIFCKLVKLVNLVMQFLKLTKLTKLTEQIFAESLKSLKSLMQFFAGKESGESTVMVVKAPTNIQRISNLYLTPNRYFTRFAAVFALVFVLGVGNVWGADTTWKWTASSASELGTSTSNNVTLNQKAWTTTRSSGTNQTNLNSNCIQLGANGSAQTITLSSTAFTGQIKSVAVECSSYQGKHSVSISVGGTSYLSSTATASWTTVNTKTGTPAPSATPSTGEIQISFTKGNSARALYIKSITVVYDPNSGGGGSTPTACETPTFSPTAGSYIGTQSVTISSTTTGSTIYYTTNGSDPTTSSSHGTVGSASATVSVSSTQTLKAIAVKEGSTTSEVGTATYSIVSCSNDNFDWNLATNSYDANPTAELIKWTGTYASMQNVQGTGTSVINYIPTSKSSTRFYSSNTLTITPASGTTISHVVFTATTDNYANALRNSTWTNATASGSATYVIVTPKDGTSAFSAAIGGTCGFTNVNVCYSACDKLGQINGSVSWTNGTSATLSWANDGNVNSYSVTCKQGETNKGTVGSITGTTTKSCTVTGLTAGQTYTFTINASGDATHCDASQVISATAPKITAPASATALSGSNYAEGATTGGTPKSFNVSAEGLIGNLTVTAPSGFEVCSTQGGTYTGSIELSASGSGAYNKTVTNATVWVRLKSGASQGSYGPSAVTISGGGAANNTNVTIAGTVSPSCHTPSITAQSTANASYNMNVAATALSVTAAKGDAGDPALTYQWYSNTENSKTTPAPTPIEGATSSSYTPLTTAAGTKYYFCEVSSGACSETSNIAAITVNTPTLTVSETSRAFGDKAVCLESPYYTMTFTVEGSNLAKDAPITISGADGMFSVDVTSIDQTSAGAVSTTIITVTYNPTAAGSHNATLTIASTGATSKTVALSGTGKWKATFMNGTNLEEHSFVLVANNAVPSKPSNPAACDANSTTFIGWTQSTWTGRKTQSQVDELTDANVKIYKSGDNLPAMVDHVTYYPVFAKGTEVSTPVANTWTRITSTSQLTDGATVLLVQYYADKAINNTPGATNCTANAEITNSTANLRWIAEQSGSKWKFKTSGGSYLSTNSLDDQTALSLNDTYNEWSITEDASYSNCFNLNNGNDLEYYSSFKVYTYSSKYASAYPFYIYIQKTTTTTTYSDYITTCLNCNVAPAFGEVSNSAVTVSNATVTCAGITKGTCDIDEYGFFYKTTESGVTEDDTKIQISDNADAPFTTDVSSFSKAFEAGTLTPNTHYYFKPYAKVNGVNILGAETDFTTKSITVVANNNNYGTVTGSNFSWTATPATGYTYAATPYTFATGETNTTVNISGNAVTIASTASENVALTINFAPKTMMVTLNNQGATTAGQESVTGTYAAGLPSITENLPEKTGYTFQGYYENQNGGGKKYYNADGTADQVWNKEVATTIHAYWQPISYTVTLDVTDATAGDEQTVLAEFGTTMPLETTAEVALAAPTRTGHTFTGWWNGETQYYSYNNSIIASARTWDIANNTTTLTAKWSINSYLLTWSLGGGKVATAGTAAEKDATAPSGLVVYNSEITAPVVTRTGYTFDSWNETPVETMPDHEVTYTAIWTARQFTVTLNNNGATTAGTESVLATYDAAMPTITIPTKDGYRFDGYGINTDGSGKLYYNADGTSANPYIRSTGSHILYAKWTPLLSYSINGTVDNTLTAGTDIAMPTSADAPESCGDCWELVGWSTNASATSISENYYAKGTQHTFTEPTTLYAVFGKIHEESYSDYATTPSCPTYEVRWHVIDNVTTDHTTECTGITSIPEVDDEIEFRCKGNKTVFMGWSATNIGFHPTSDADEIAALNLFTEVEDAPTIDSDKDFYAVFADVAPEKPVSKTVTYAITAKNTLTPSGDVLDGSSASIAETYGTSKQMTGGNSQTLTLTGYSGYKITKIVLSMRSNSGGGAGKLSYAVNNGSATYLVGTSGEGVAFNNSAWNGSYTTSYVNVTKDKLNIACGSTNTIIKIEATANSLYCESYSITYERIVTYSDYFTECCPQKAVVVADLDDAVGTIIADKELACEGEVITLLMEENHYDFVSWNVHKTGDESTKPTAPVATGDPGEYTFTMPTPAYPVTVEANWTPKNYKITIADVANGSATVKENTTYSQDGDGKWIVPYGETVTLKAEVTDPTQYYFAGWTLSPEIPGAALNQAEMEITMPGNFTATPAFALIMPSELTLVPAPAGEFNLAATLTNGDLIDDMASIYAGTGIKVAYTMNGQYEVTSWEMKDEDLNDFTSYSTSGNAVNFSMPNKDLTVRLNVQPYVTLDLSAENGSISAVAVNSSNKDVAASYNVHTGESIEVTAIPTDNTYKFVEWQKTGIADNNFDSEDAYAYFTVGASNMTLKAVFTKKTSYTLTLVSGGKTQEVIPALEGDAILTLLAGKTATALTGYTFKGWSASENGTEISSDDLKLNSNTTVYAVYSKDAYYEKVTSTSGITNGQYLIVYEGGGVAFNGGLSTLDASSNTIDVTISNSKIKVSEATVAAEFTINATSNTIKSANNKYIGRSANSNGLDASDSEVTNALSIADGNFVVVGAEGAYLRYNSSSGQERFRYFKSDSYTNQKAIQLYKYIEDGANESNPSTTVANGEEFEIDEAMTLNNLTVEAGGKVTLSNKLTVVGTFSIETTMAGGNSGQLEGATASNFEASEAYIDITLGAGGTNQQWHAFTVPFPVDVMNGIYDLNNEKLYNEVNYAIMEYHGDLRAKGEYGWKKIRTTLVPGTFYIMATDGYRTTYRFKKKAGAALVAENSKEIFKFAASGDGVSTDAGWNGVGNPTLTYGKVGVEVQVLDPESYTFVKKDANSTNFVVGTPFFYQAAAAGSISMLEANAGASYAPRRVAANGFEKIKVAFGNEEFTDYLDVSASEEALNEYQIGKDLAKMTMTNTPKVAQIFGKAYNTKLCMVHAPMVNDQAEVVLELYAPQAGTYTISVPTEREDASLYLTKDGNIIWDLTMSPYEAEFDKGATEGYGLMLVRKAPQVTTGVENVQGDKTQCTKVILNDHVYILRDGQLYDVTGKAVK